jgi:undecaprenyl-phosphate 4-deoxy-4-formamido-L-arabinose transferase
MTIDADLQNPPEEIPKLLEKMDAGHDYVGSIRRHRHDSQWRKVASRWMNRLRERITGIQITDQGCMMRCYDRSIIDAILSSRETTTFIPVLAYIYAANPVEVTVEHEDRAAGESKYSLLSLIQLNFDLMTSFSIVPLQTFSVLGMLVASLSFVLVVVLAIRRLIVGPEAEGLFTLFGIAFFLIGLCLFGIGMLGEYIGRLYKQVRRRPRYMIQAVLAADDESSPRPGSAS